MQILDILLFEQLCTVKVLKFSIKKHNLDIFRPISEKCHKFNKLVIFFGHFNNKKMFDCDLTQISIVKYLQNYLYFWIFFNLKFKFACVKLSLRFFLDALYIHTYYVPFRAMPKFKQVF